MNNYFLDQNIQNAFYTLHEYWIKNYPNATLTIGKQTTITNSSRTHTVIKPKKTTTRRERIGSKMYKYLLESITAVILIPSIILGKTIKEILPIDKNLSYGKQPELYGHLVTESEEKEEEEAEDQEFTYQNPITESPEFETPNLQTQQNLNPENPEIETPNIQTLPTQDNRNPDLINQQNLPPIIGINQPLINPIVKLLQPPLQLPSQQLMQQQSLQLPLQQSNLNPIAYALITKLDNFTSEENDVQIWLNNVEKAIVANGWNNDSEPLPESRPIPIYLSAYDAPTNLSTASLLTTTTSNLSGTATKSCQRNSGTGSTQNPNFQHYLSLLVTPEDTTFSNPGIEQQQPPTNNILPATITKNKFLDAIFSFELKKPLNTLLFSEAALEEKPITTMYTDVKVNDHFIKLILNSGHQVDHTVSVRIITTNRATKTPIGEINDFSIEVNDIIVLIKVLVMEATQYQALVELVLSQNGQHTRVPAMCGHFKAINTTASLIDLEEKNQNLSGKHIKSQQQWQKKTEENRTYLECRPSLKHQPRLRRITQEKEKGKMKEEGSLPTATHAVVITRNTRWQLSSIAMHVSSNALEDQNEWENEIIHYECGMTFLREEEYVIKSAKEYPHNEHELWRMASVKAKDATTSKLLEIKNNLLSLPKPEYVLTFDIFGNIKDNLKEFYEHYQWLAPTQEEQEQQLEEINTQLCDHCLISCDFQYCNKCDLIYNPLPCMIYTISEEKKPISSCTLELESIFNPNLNSNNDNDENTGSSFIQYGDNNDNNSNSDLNPDPDYEQYIALLDLTKEQELK
ncbi:hypothetical protein G9A89_013009 [Geosiphon pyriformis]|nr:hypothetical protein G9A89_013009 [Geosiphon pyriformis]